MLNINVQKLNIYVKLMNMNSYFQTSIEKIKEIVKIKSVKAPSKPNMPFGEGIYKALNFALNLSKELGFKSYNYDNYIGEIVFGEGADEDGLGVLCHLDVVPEGDEKKWTFPPYSATISNGYLYGRGVVDDKAPAILCLFALKELKDAGFIPSKKIKLILGCDEESGWGCIEHYKKVAVMPKTGFSPDGDFPVIYAEKGILHIESEFNLTGRIVEIFGGERVNMVCDCAYAKISNLTENEIITLKNNGVAVENGVIKAYGKSAHGSTPEMGENAINKLFYALTKIGVLELSTYNALFKNHNILKDIIDQTGKLTFSPNVCYKEGNKLKVKIDIRYPATYLKEQITNILNGFLNYIILNEQAPIMCEKNGYLVKTLINIYNKEFGVKKEPIAIGGGTYARALKSGVAFGPSFITDNMCHVIDERISIEHLEKCYKVYLKAIKELVK